MKRNIQPKTSFYNHSQSAQAPETRWPDGALLEKQCSIQLHYRTNAVTVLIQLKLTASFPTRRSCFPDTRTCHRIPSRNTITVRASILHSTADAVAVIAAISRCSLTERYAASVRWSRFSSISSVSTPTPTSPPFVRFRFGIAYCFAQIFHPEVGEGYSISSCLD